MALMSAVSLNKKPKGVGTRPQRIIEAS